MLFGPLCKSIAGTARSYNFSCAGQGPSQPRLTVRTASATYARFCWFSAATQMRPVPTA